MRPSILRRLMAGRPKHPPIWAPTGLDPDCWATLLTTSPAIINTLPSISCTLGAAGAVGTRLKKRRVDFLMMPSWTLEPPGHSERLAERASAYLAGHRRHTISFLCNTAREADLMRAHGHDAVMLNHNCLVDEMTFHPMPQVEPIYDAVYNAQLSPFKRNDLARDIGSLALIFYYGQAAGSIDAFRAIHAHLSALMPNARFLNTLTAQGTAWLTRSEVNDILAQSRVGLCLSAEEGAMFASMEYLLAGLSVASTPSLGGRDVFFDDEYCIICDPDPRSVRDAVDALVARNVPRDYVRRKTLDRANAMRRRYIDLVQGLIDRGHGTMRFEDRFWELIRGEGIIQYRAMTEFAALTDTLPPLSRRDRFRMSWR